MVARVLDVRRSWALRVIPNVVNQPQIIALASLAAAEAWGVLVVGRHVIAASRDGRITDAEQVAMRRVAADRIVEPYLRYARRMGIEVQ